MITLNVFFDVRQEHHAAFLKLLTHMVIESNKEDGCRTYQLLQNHIEPYSYMLLERWETQEHLDAHAQAPHWKHFGGTVNGYLDEDYDEHHYREIDF